MILTNIYFDNQHTNISLSQSVNTWYFLNAQFSPFLHCKNWNFLVWAEGTKGREVNKRTSFWKRTLKNVKHLLSVSIANNNKQKLFVNWPIFHGSKKSVCAYRIWFKPYHNHTVFIRYTNDNCMLLMCSIGQWNASNKRDIQIKEKTTKT